MKIKEHKATLLSLVLHKYVATSLTLRATYVKGAWGKGDEENIRILDKWSDKSALKHQKLIKNAHENEIKQLR